MSEPPLVHSKLAAEFTEIARHPHDDRASEPAPVRRRPPVLIKRRETGREPSDPTPPSAPASVGSFRARPTFLDPIETRVVWRATELVPYGGVFPPDGRKPYFDLRFPWRCVCRVMNRKGGSGALVGPRHVLTASHVIDWDGPMESVLFAQSGTILDTATAVEVIAFEKIDDVGYTSADDDYAVIVLDKPVGDRLGFLGARTYDAAWDDETDVWCNIAHAPSILNATAPVFQTNFFLDEDEFDLGGGRTLESESIDLEPGMSGSPVFGFWPGGPFVVGVVSAGTPGGGGYNAIAGGNNLTVLVKEARSKFP